MYKQTLRGLIIVIAANLLLLACSTEATAPPDLVATEVAVQKTAAAILTADASTAIAVAVITDTPLPPTATFTPEPAAALPSDTPLPPTATSTLVPPTDTPTLPPPPQRKSVPPDGGDRLDEFYGEIVLPGSAEIRDDGNNRQVIFHNEVYFQLKVRDPHKGSFDGAGVKTVEFDVRDDKGSVYQRTEQHAGYCVFGGGEPDCNIRQFDDGWGNGHQMIENTQYTAEMRILLESGDELNWRWRFFVAR